MQIYIEIHGSLGTEIYLQLTTKTVNCDSLCKFFKKFLKVLYFRFISLISICMCACVYTYTCIYIYIYIFVGLKTGSQLQSLFLIFIPSLLELAQLDQELDSAHSGRAVPGGVEGERKFFISFSEVWFCLLWKEKIQVSPKVDQTWQDKMIHLHSKLSSSCENAVCVKFLTFLKILIELQLSS